ncbi:MAG: filamentous hemagglutinin N-terminal domain-containing protein, partial [Cyanobacteria bacterium P01_A01_bin.83]
FYFTFLFILAFSNSLPAQVIEDNTLSTDVNTENNRDFTVDAGEQRGNNLFHSFQEFSIPNNGSVYFDNGVTIKNIISRVTGSSISEINGLIKSNGAANLFLLNPNGIIFGENASLNIGGSFVGTTAESLTFTDGTEFSAKASNAKPLLTVSVPLGLQFGSNPGEIINRANSSVTNPFDPTGQDQTKVGLSTSPGKTFALFGGNITFDGGAASAPTGNIELGSVAANSLVILEPVNKGWRANYDNVTRFQDLVFNRLASVDASGEGGGDIKIQGRNLQILDGSGIISNTLGSIDGGTIEIQASDLVEINGSDSTNQKSDFSLASIGIFVPFSSSIISDTFGQGDAADIKITSNKLELLNGAKLQTRTLATSNDFTEKFGDSGNIVIQTSDAVRLEGSKPSLRVLDDFQNIFPIPSEAEIFLNSNLFTDIATGSSIEVGSTSNGSAGNVNISTNRLELRDASTITNAPSFFSTGDGGDISVNAQESIEIYGSNNPEKATFSLISSNTFGQGSAGNINLNTDKLVLRSGGGISTGTFGVSDGGNIILNTDEIDIKGTSGDGSLRSGFGSETFSSGDAGNVVVNTKNLSIADQGQITSRSLGSGTPGNLIVNANSLKLNNAVITVENTASLEGGNIQLQVQDNLTLTNNSRISAQAFNNANG